MTYAELIAHVAERTGYTVGAIRDVCNALRTVILANLNQEGDAVSFHQLGVFKVKKREARMVKSPFLGKDLGGEPKTGIIPEHQVLKFRPSRLARRKLNP